MAGRGQSHCESSRWGPPLRHPVMSVSIETNLDKPKHPKSNVEKTSNSTWSHQPKTFKGPLRRLRLRRHGPLPQQRREAASELRAEAVARGLGLGGGRAPAHRAGRAGAVGETRVQGLRGSEGPRKKRDGVRWNPRRNPKGTFQGSFVSANHQKPRGINP